MHPAECGATRYTRRRVIEILSGRFSSMLCISIATVRSSGRGSSARRSAGPSALGGRAGGLGDGHRGVERRCRSARRRSPSRGSGLPRCGMRGRTRSSIVDREVMWSTTAPPEWSVSVPGAFVSATVTPTSARRAARSGGRTNAARNSWGIFGKASETMTSDSANAVLKALVKNSSAGMRRRSVLTVAPIPTQPAG